jgi:type I site-specific restriction endonuclease
MTKRQERPEVRVYEVRDVLDLGLRFEVVRILNHSMHSHRLEPDGTAVFAAVDKAQAEHVRDELNRAFNQGREMAKQW